MTAPLGSISESPRQCKPTGLEAEIEAILDRLSIPYSRFHSTRTGFVIDFALYPDSQRIALEVDGPLHDAPARRSRDAFRSLILKREGWTVHRIHWSEMGSAEGRIKELLQ